MPAQAVVKMEILGCMNVFTQSAMDALFVAARYRDKPETVDAGTTEALRGVLALLATSSNCRGS